MLIARCTCLQSDRCCILLDARLQISDRAEAEVILGGDVDGSFTLVALTGGILAGLVLMLVVVVNRLVLQRRDKVRIGAELAWTRPKPDRFEVVRSRLVVGEKIGSGQFGTVSFGLLTNTRGSVQPFGQKPPHTHTHHHHHHTHHHHTHSLAISAISASCQAPPRPPPHSVADAPDRCCDGLSIFFVHHAPVLRFLAQPHNVRTPGAAVGSTWQSSSSASTCRLMSRWTSSYSRAP